VRRVMLPSLVLYALGIAAYTQITADPFAITYLIFAITGLTGTVAGPPAPGTVPPA